MMKYLLAGAALAAIAATPAAARDNSAYFGIEFGAMHANDSHVEQDFGQGTDFFNVDHNWGVDGDLIAGYDFGLFRAELEGAYKWATHDEYDDGDSSVNADGHSRAYSLMANAMVDFGRNEGLNFYAGGGAGIAWVHQRFSIVGDSDDFSIRDSKFAWQLIAGVRAPVFTHFDVGLKYRYFNTGSLRDDLEGEGRIDDVRSKFRSHSLLASLIYNFAPAAAPPPPPPPPPPPATQTCPDGSVILATDACPMPPPPPPPPPPAPERGL
jgi:opacity protein-like surface antigen